MQFHLPGEVREDFVLTVNANPEGQARQGLLDYPIYSFNCVLALYWHTLSRQFKEEKTAKGPYPVF